MIGLKWPSSWELYESGGAKLHIRRNEMAISHCGQKLHGNENLEVYKPGDVCKRCLKAWRTVNGEAKVVLRTVSVM